MQPALTTLSTSPGARPSIHDSHQQQRNLPSATNKIDAVCSSLATTPVARRVPTAICDAVRIGKHQPPVNLSAKVTTKIGAAVCDELSCEDIYHLHQASANPQTAALLGNLFGSTSVCNTFPRITIDTASDMNMVNTVMRSRLFRLALASGCVVVIKPSRISLPLSARGHVFEEVYAMKHLPLASKRSLYHRQVHAEPLLTRMEDILAQLRKVVKEVERDIKGSYIIEGKITCALGCCA